MKLSQNTKGFTLIELLVVVSIIALLAVGTTAVYPKIMAGVRAKNCLKSIKQIHLMLTDYAGSHDGNFPSQNAEGADLNSSNEAYRQLFIYGKIDDERLFQVPNSKWHGTKGGPDGNIGTPENQFQNALEAGENHWAYQTQLNQENSDSTLPLIFDGGKDGAPGTYSRDKNEKGGVWQGRYVVFCTVGGSAEAYEPDATLIVKKKKNGRDVDIFSEEFGTVRNNLKNPL